MTEIYEATCYRHPDRATGLSCTECDRPICASCSIQAAVGQRCPECVRQAGPQEVITARDLNRRPSVTEIPVTYTIIGVALVISLLSVVLPDLWGEIVIRAGMWPPGVELGEWWRMLTVITVHSRLTGGLGIMHVGFNMYITYRLGAQIEREMGSWAFAAMYLAAAAAGSAFAFFLGPDALGVGASGAAFGLFGLWLAPAIRRRGTAWGRRLMNELGGVLVLNALVPFVVPNVAWEAHLGGLLAGLLIGWAWTDQRFGRTALTRTAVAAAVLVVSIVATQV
ncbi:MAG: rhomboid family intramembrane serine protease [Acidimicrobiia bacterium]|nr:rhomboid family intramembrane serine protease [Acidimicrobiia bacterium]MDH4309602.1 rhomboid family intramembrane serine protease [Acidimicrobiia bacterium]